jgi:outer membrane protein assembly factor BamD (BamD/ComL family)
VLQSCGVLFYREEDELKRQEAEYRAYQQQNTIESYQEFIKKYPDNLFVAEAKCSIEHLEFAPYEQKDTIEGYRDFIKSYPANRNISRAVEIIDQLEFKQIEDTDTIAAYREFLRQHPRSNYIMLAQERLQDLEFRELDTTCQKLYKFDLLLYRLNVNRMQQQLESTSADIANFTLFASTPRPSGRQCFTTKLIYGDALLRLDTNNNKSSELLFNAMISKLLVYLDQ